MDKVITPRRKLKTTVDPRKVAYMNDKYIINFILAQVTEWYEIDDVGVLAIRSREHLYIPARHLSMALIRRYTTYSLANIGKLFKRDHTTVIHARQVIWDACDTEDPILYPAWKYITSLMSTLPIRNQ